MASEPSHEEVDPIAKKLTEAAARNQEVNEAAAGEKLLTADFAKFARDRAPTEFEKIEQIVLLRTSKINAQHTLSQPQFRYAQNSHSIEVGIFSASFAIVKNGQFQLRLSVGLASDAHQRMAQLPVVEPLTWHYRAAADQDGFFWWDEAAAKKCPPDELVSNVLEALADLLIAPLRFEDEASF